MTDLNRNGFEPDCEAWDAWHPGEVAERLARVDVPWYVAGGWAIDLFLGEQRREHEDLEIGVPRDRYEPIAEALPGLEFFTVGDGKAWPIAEHQDVFEAHHQTWGRDRECGRWRLDVMREPGEGNIWIARRDPRIRLPYSTLIRRTADAIPFGAPEVILLFKAKATRPKDDGDFAAVLPILPAESRQWLQHAMELIHPDHHWLNELTNDGG